MRNFVVLASLLIATSFCSDFGSSRAFAQTSDDERARTHFEAGRSYYEQARYDDALREFQNAFQLSGRPALLLNLSQAHERSLRFDEAIADIQYYLQLVPDSPDRKTLEQRIVRLQELRSRVAPQPTAAQGEPQPAPQPAAEPAPAPATAPAPAPAVEPAPEPKSSVNVPAWILIGSGGAALIGSLVTGVMADSKHSDLERQCAMGCPSSVQSDIDSGETLAVVSTVLMAVGLVAGGIGATLLILDSGSSNETAHTSAGQVQLAASPTPFGAGAKILF